MRLNAPFTSLWIQGVITWLTCALSGLLAVSLTAAHEVASPLYLPAGLGLACVLGWGRWMLAAVALGAATVSFLTLNPSWHTAAPPEVFAMSVTSAVGACLQAWLGTQLVQRNAQGPLTLETPRSIVRFLFLAGPVACVVNATLSSSAMMLLGLLPPSEGLRAALGWWAGDSLGVLAGALIMLPMVGRPATLWRTRRMRVALPLLAMTLLLSMAVRQVRLWQIDREVAVFNQNITTATHAVNQRLASYLDALAALNGVFDASTVVDRGEFTRASQYWVGTLKGIQAVGWDERLSAKDLDAFERQQRLEGLSTYRVFDAPGQPQTHGPDVVAVRYIEPREGNEMALGYNVLSSPISRKAYDQARLQGQVVATSSFKLQQESGQQKGVVVYRPVYKGQPFTPQARAQASMGAVFLALRMDDALKAMLTGLPAYLDACLLDASEAGLPLLAGSPSCYRGDMRQSALHHAVIPIDFAGRQWQLLVWSEAALPVAGLSATSWMLAISGVAFIAALGSLLLVMTGHTRRLEGAMKEAHQQREAAEQANNAKSEFLSRMSHELRTPLNAVLGFAQVMELDHREPLPATQRHRVEQIQQAGWHLLDLIDDVLDIAHIDRGTLRLSTEPLSIQQQLTMAIEPLMAQAKEQGVQLRLQQDVPDTWGVNADATRLRQILSSLIGQAIKVNRKGGEVNVTVSESKNEGGTISIGVAVQNTGMSTSTSSEHDCVDDGAAISFVVSRHLAELMGGKLDVQRQAHQGSTFTLRLPAIDLVHPRTSAPAPSPAHQPASITPRPRHVLYVEDNLANSEVIRAALSARPWVTVTVAPTTEEGLVVLHNRLRGTKPDLILLDVHLPDVSGQELLKLIKANPDTASIPVIMISADAMPEQIDAALSAGAYCYLTKPVQLSELLRQVDDLLPA
ncbi:MAG: CHASE domain-containing protein [Aquabacterium sp.]|nr:CHASE domain-containing protein [Aquabacterium sp.]